MQTNIENKPDLFRKTFPLVMGAEYVHLVTGDKVVLISRDHSSASPCVYVRHHKNSDALIFQVMWPVDEFLSEFLPAGSAYTTPDLFGDSDV